MSTKSASNARDDVRDYVNDRIDQILNGLDQVIDLKRTYWIDCDNCSHRIATRYPDVKAITDLLRLLFDQGYGRPGTDNPAERESDISALQGYSPEVRARVLAKCRAMLDEEKAALDEEQAARPVAAG